MPGSGAGGGGGLWIFGALALAVFGWEVVYHRNARRWAVWSLPAAAAVFFVAQALESGIAIVCSVVGVTALLPYALFVVRERQQGRR